ncbi:hypothetical protein RY27_10935 [Litorilinea aerophila]|nr:hypothetical protein RY27_10935 [Litorilinea aerophila]
MSRPVEAVGSGNPPPREGLNGRVNDDLNDEPFEPYPVDDRVADLEPTVPMALRELEEELAPAPSLLVVLGSALAGIAGGVLSLYVVYGLFRWPIELSVGAATFALLMALLISGVILSALVDSRALAANLLFSCSLVVAVLLFFTCCILAGALAAVLLLAW